MRSQLYSRGVAKSRALGIESARLQETLARLRQHFPESDILRTDDAEIERQVQGFVESDRRIELALPPIPMAATASVSMPVTRVVVDALRVLLGFVGLQASHNESVTTLVTEGRVEPEPWSELVRNLAATTTLVERAQALLAIGRQLQKAGCFTRLLEKAEATSTPWDWIHTGVLLEGVVPSLLTEKSTAILPELALNVGSIAALVRDAKTATS